MSNSTRLNPILGTMRLGRWGANLSTQDLNRFLWQAMEAGFDSLDTADIYGDHTTNRELGAAIALSPELRAHFSIIAKLGICMPYSPGNNAGVQWYRSDTNYLQQALDQYQREFDGQSFSQLLLHRVDLLWDLDALAKFATRAQQSGQIASFGMSNGNAAHCQALAARGLNPCANQIALALSEHSALHELLPICQGLRIPVQAYSPLQKIAFESVDMENCLNRIQAQLGFSRDQALIAWVAAIPGVQVILGSTQIARLLQQRDAALRGVPSEMWYSMLVAARGVGLP